MTRFSRWCTAVSLVGLCACAQTGSHSAARSRDPFLQDTQVAAAADESPDNSMATASRSGANSPRDDHMPEEPSLELPVNSSPVSLFDEKPGVVRLRKQASTSSGIRNISYETPSDNPLPHLNDAAEIAPAGGFSPEFPPQASALPGGTERADARQAIQPPASGESVLQTVGQGHPEPRHTVYCEDGVTIESQSVLARKYPDEYVFDGGDRDHPVQVAGTVVSGLETEDTVIEFFDDQGRRHIKPSTRVAVYAPRFAAVTSVSGQSEGVGVNKLAANNVALRGAGLRNRTATIGHVQREGTERMVVRLRGSGVQTTVNARAVDLAVNSNENVQVVRPAAEENFVRTGEFDQVEGVQILEAVQMAQGWTRVLYPAIAASTTAGNELRATFEAAEIIGRKVRARPPRLRIVKLADKDAAQPGEEILFTIRFDNFGDGPLTDVSIVDNLTERLEYVEDSATSTRDGELVTEPNSEGSLILRWAFDAPLPAGEGGVVTFKARVR